MPSDYSMIPKKPALGLDPGVGAGFRKRSCSNNKIEPGDDSKKSHRALVGGLLLIVAFPNDDRAAIRADDIGATAQAVRCADPVVTALLANDLDLRGRYGVVVGHG